MFTDTSVLESYSNDGEAVITARVYPPEEYAGLAIVADSTSKCTVVVENLRVYSIGSIQLD